MQYSRIEVESNYANTVKSDGLVQVVGRGRIPIVIAEFAVGGGIHVDKTATREESCALLKADVRSRTF